MEKVIKNMLDDFSTPMSFRDPKTWWILSLLPQGLYTVSIRLNLRAKKVLKKKKKKSKVPKGKSQMTTAPLTLDWITSPVVPHWQLSSGRAHCGADQ